MYYNDYNRSPEEREPIETNSFHVSDPEPPKKRKRLGLKIAAGCLVCALVGGALGGGGALLATGQLGGEKTVVYEGTRPTAAVSLANVDGKTVLSGEEIYAANLESVVGVYGDVTTNIWGQTVRNPVSGSGFVISADGYILTNYHVIDGVSDIKVTFSNGTSYDAILVGGEEENDIAVLKIDASGLRPVVLGNSDALQVGEPVYAIGNPLGELTFTFTGGYVSAKDRSITMSDGTIMNMIQTDAAINSGNSGGALINEYGQVVGITTLKMSSYADTIEGLGFAIPTTTVKSVVDQLIETGYIPGRPTIGITVNTIPTTVEDGTPGLQVIEVDRSSDAWHSGLRSGDIIVEANGTTIASMADLEDVKAGLEVGDTISLRIFRMDRYQVIEVTLVEQYTLDS